MDADLDLLCTTVYVTADDLLPSRARNWRRRLTDAEVVTLCVAQSLMGISSDRRFLRAARRQLGHLFPVLPSQSALHKRRARLRDAIDWLIGVFASASPAAHDEIVVIDSTPVECGRSVETARRSRLADSASHGYSRSHSRWFWGMRLHLATSLDGSLRACQLESAERPEREIALNRLLPRAAQSGARIAICDKGYAGRDLAQQSQALFGISIIRPARRGEDRADPHLAPIRQRIESAVQTLKDILTLERHGARTLENLRARIGQRLLAYSAAVWLNHHLGRPSRSLAPYTA